MRINNEIYEEICKNADSVYAINRFIARVDYMNDREMYNNPGAMSMYEQGLQEALGNLHTELNASLSSRDSDQFFVSGHDEVDLLTYTFEKHGETFTLATASSEETNIILNVEKLMEAAKESPVLTPYVIDEKNQAAFERAQQYIEGDLQYITDLDMKDPVQHAKALETLESVHEKLNNILEEDGTKTTLGQIVFTHPLSGEPLISNVPMAENQEQAKFLDLNAAREPGDIMRTPDGFVGMTAKEDTDYNRTLQNGEDLVEYKASNPLTPEV